MGLVNFCGRFINVLARIAEPLTRLTRKDIPFKWENDQEKAFNKLKDALSSPKTLAYFDGNARTKVIADARPVGLGGILVQEQNGEQRVICYASRSLTDVERRYTQKRKHWHWSGPVKDFTYTCMAENLNLLQITSLWNIYMLQDLNHQPV